MLSAVSYRAFKSLVKTTLAVEPCTVIVGLNGSGKSNAVDGLLFLQRIASGMPLSQALDGVEGVTPGLRGGSQGAPPDGEDSFVVGCTVNHDEVDYKYELEVEVSPRLVVKREQLDHIQWQNGVPTTTAIWPRTDDPPTSDEPALGQLGRITQLLGTKMARIAADLGLVEVQHSHPLSLTDFGQVLLDIQNRAKSTPEPADALPATTEQLANRAPKAVPHLLAPHHLWSCLAQVQVLDLQPNLMRHWSTTSRTTLSFNGENLSAAVAKLLENEADEKELLHWVGLLSEHPISKIGLFRAPTNEVLLYLQESFAARQMKTDARRLSDGTLRYLAILTALITAPKQSTLVIEEIDQGLHPSRAKVLIDAIHHFHHLKQIDVIATTHNPALINLLEGSGLQGLVLCHREPGTGLTRLTSWLDLPQGPALLAKGRLGDLATNGELSHALQHLSLPDLSTGD